MPSRLMSQRNACSHVPFHQQPLGSLDQKLYESTKFSKTNLIASNAHGRVNSEDITETYASKHGITYRSPERGHRAFWYSHYKLWVHDRNLWCQFVIS